VFHDSVTSQVVRAPLTTFHKRSVLNGKRDAAAVLHLYSICKSKCKSCYNKAGSMGKAPV